MAEPKTRKTGASVDAFIAGVADDTRRADAQRLVALMQDATGEPPAMWGPSIIGFGSCVNDAGVEWMRLGFSPRAGKTAIYILSKPADWDVRLEQLGRHETGKSCLYVKRLDDVDLDVLRDMVAAGWATSRAAMP
jgi:hypothetical protein